MKEELKLDDKETRSPESSVKRPGSAQSSITSDRGSVSSADKVPQSSSGAMERKRSDDGSHCAMERAVITQSPVVQSHTSYQSGAAYRHNNLLKAELSLDEDTTSAVSQTSSTSGKTIASFSNNRFKPQY